MATPMRPLVLSSIRRILSRHLNYGKLLTSRNQCAAISTNNDTPDAKVDPENYFIRKDVQEILRKLTVFDVDRIFSERFTDIKPPKYKMMTDTQFNEMYEEYQKKGSEKMQLVPFFLKQEEKEEVLSRDPEIQGHDPHTYIFTDITFGIKERERLIVVRNEDGTLRLANPGERNRINQVYYPQPGRFYRMPSMFMEEHLEPLLDKQDYEYILDRACVQFEPDEPDFIRVSNRTYEHIHFKRSYDVLRATRHFGSLTYYLAWYQRCGGLIADMLQQNRLSDAADTVHLFHILHPHCASLRALHQLPQPQTDPRVVVKLYAEHDKTYQSEIELALQTYDGAHAAVSV